MSMLVDWRTFLAPKTGLCNITFIVRLELVLERHVNVACLMRCFRVFSMHDSIGKAFYKLYTFSRFMPHTVTDSRHASYHLAYPIGIKSSTQKVLCVVLANLSSIFCL